MKLMVNQMLFNSPTGEKGKEGQIPAAGTIKEVLYLMKFQILLKDMQLLKQMLSPLTADQIDAEKGKELFNIYCAICHGEGGDGKGNLV